LIRRIAEEDLPSPQDNAVLLPPVVEAMVRRVDNLNLWVYFTFTDHEVLMWAVSASPPVPIKTDE